ncbi:DNA translocase FtsK, partial [Rhodoblastus sp.]|uniref:DNA translocase FtsK n=2 Tax=Rhodoblastus sp. TaxID=1962975 RepID=UPI003F96C675
MLMTLDQWLARFFGAGRRADRAAPLAQRASFGLDGVEMRQIDGDLDLREWDGDEAASPYRPYVRRPRAVLLDPPSAAAPPAFAAPENFAPAATRPAPYLPSPPSAFFEDERARLEVEAALKSRAILAAAQEVWAPEPEPAPLFQTDLVVESPCEPAAPQFFRADRPNVRFTRTPETSIARRKAEEEAQRRAAEEEARRVEEEARLKAEETARNLEEARLAQTHAISHAAEDMSARTKPRVRFARTPDRPLAERRIETPVEAPAAPAPLPSFGAFANMGARFSFAVGFGGFAGRASAPAPAPAPAPVEEAEKPAKVRIRVKAVAAPTEPEPEPVPAPAPAKAAEPVRLIKRAKTPAGGFLERIDAPAAEYDPFALDMLTPPPHRHHESEPADELEVNADALEKTLEDFGVRGDVLNAHPGPVVTLYEFEPAPGIKSSRVIGLADDIARSMSAVSARVAVVPGRNAIGIELPNPRRETVFLRELLASADFVETRHKLAIALGKTIGGEPVIVDLAKMPHLLVAGTTGSGKSVAINTMILSLLYRLKPQDCRLIMVDPKMLELSVYDGIPHLLTPVVTDPKKAVVA